MILSITLVFIIMFTYKTFEKVHILFLTKISIFLTCNIFNKRNYINVCKNRSSKFQLGFFTYIKIEFFK